MTEDTKKPLVIDLQEADRNKPHWLHRRPTHDQIEALRRYAADHGRTWKAQLRDEWMNACQGISDFDQQGLLQQIRNTFGPAWLHTFRLEDHV